MSFGRAGRQPAFRARKPAPVSDGHAGFHSAPQLSRREFLAFGWFPFFGLFGRRHVSLAGAHFRIVRNGRSSRRFLTIHGNEETARQVLSQFIKTHEGMAYLVEGHERNVAVDGGAIDPNRMFSRAGAEASLKSLNPGWTAQQVEGVLRTLDRGREHLVEALTPPRHGLLIALHNNSEEYSVSDEVSISDATSLREPGNPHAFFLCTEPADYAILSRSPYNVVLQRDKPEPDDGSLSRLMARRGTRYVNLEVRLGDSDRQAEMIGWANVNLP